MQKAANRQYYSEDNSEAGVAFYNEFNALRLVGFHPFLIPQNVKGIENINMLQLVDLNEVSGDLTFLSKQDHLKDLLIDNLNFTDQIGFIKNYL